MPFTLSRSGPERRQESLAEAGRGGPGAGMGLDVDRIAALAVDEPAVEGVQLCTTVDVEELPVGGVAVVAVVDLLEPQLLVARVRRGEAAGLVLPGAESRRAGGVAGVHADVATARR